MLDGGLRQPTSAQVEALFGEAANCRLLAKRLEGTQQREFAAKLADVFEELARLRTRHPKA